MQKMKMMTRFGRRCFVVYPSYSEADRIRSIGHGRSSLSLLFPFSGSLISITQCREMLINFLFRQLFPFWLIHGHDAHLQISRLEVKSEDGL